MGRQWASPAFNFPGRLLPFQLTPSVALGEALPWGPSCDECCRLQPGQGAPGSNNSPWGRGRPGWSSGKAFLCWEAWLGLCQVLWVLRGLEVC